MLSDCSSTSRVIKLTLTLPPPQASPDYFYNLLLQYGQVCKVKLIKTLSEVQVFTQMDSFTSAIKVKQGIDALGSPFIICELLNYSSFSILPADDAKEYYPTSPIYQNSLSSTSLITETPQKQLDLSNNSDSLSNNNSKSDLNDSLQTIQYQNKNNQQAQQHEPSTVVCLTNLINQQCNASKLYNVFSNFGNINQILLIKFQSFALIQYENEENAIFVNENCQNLIFMDSEISVSFAAYDAIEKLKHLSALYTPQDYFVGSDHTHRQDELKFYSKRFNNHKKVPLLAPTRILHISNLKPSCSNYDMMWDLFSDFGVVEVSEYIYQLLFGGKSSQFPIQIYVPCENGISRISNQMHGSNAQL